ncbi:hypothetical protein CcaverHIS002_0303310 [Cutaneotrichosporon cavernicola]|uniref:C2H2-type domain-containing protein n=1 Tax=Cutaneotrichosporon cavernicola TaxID=279322 RepID=A0AA48L0R7_9TREE|nr:uncharacterized protein CcaverHIS019_0303310 [Cutaneotrichosporon cavernicola]BEI82463.1 hypothetical protein CcaverHIS002_0303310 [Cutaneotrichosporon cavernicola]BEI90261.1 hypothetical protein CcaverHIS019_0303310 [Cutaneotrichosporon cavernicola]
MDSNADSLANSPDAGPSRTLVCECGRRFTRIENLRRHQRNHEESKLSCPTCGRTFRPWLTEEVYLRTKAWCVSERTIRWPDLSTANYLINTHFERVEPQLPIIHLPTFEASHAPPALITALLASGAHATPHIRARTFSCQVAETLRVLEPSDLDSLHVLLLAYLAASSCGNPRAHLILASLGSHVRTLRLLGPRQTESDFATWVRHERATRLGLAVLLFDTTLGLSDVASAPIPDQERWLLTSDAWVAREQTSVGAALATLPRYPATVGEFGASVLYTTIHYGIRAYRAEERVFGHTQEVLGLALPARVHALETLLEAAGHAYGQSVGYHLGYVLLRAPRVEDLESKSTTDPLPIVHAAHLLISAGWPLPKDNIVFSGAGYHALLILRAWASQPGPRDEDALVAELMAPRATAAPHVGPHGILPVEQAVTPAHVLKLGLQWMVNSGASGYANRLARLLDREEG